MINTRIATICKLAIGFAICWVFLHLDLNYFSKRRKILYSEYCYKHFLMNLLFGNMLSCFISLSFT